MLPKLKNEVWQHLKQLYFKVAGTLKKTEPLTLKWINVKT